MDTPIGSALCQVLTTDRDKDAAWKVLSDTLRGIGNDGLANARRFRRPIPRHQADFSDISCR